VCGQAPADDADFRQRGGRATPPDAESDSENAFGVVAEAGYCSAYQTAGRFGSDTELFADFAEAFALTVDQAEA